jgi:hypothetical protein
MTLVSNHLGRRFLLVYLGAMHLLVFVSLWLMAHASHSQTQGCETTVTGAQLINQQHIAALRGQQIAAAAGTLVGQARKLLFDS